MPDPFKVRNAELEDPGEIGIAFVEDHTEFSKVSAHEHTVAWGSRGSGKTMHLRYLEPAAWRARRGEKGDTASFLEFLASSDGFLAVYINCREPALSRAEFSGLEKRLGTESPLPAMIADRYLAQVALLRISSTLLDQLLLPGALEVDCSHLPMSLRAEKLPERNPLQTLLIEIRRKSEENLDKLRHLADEMLLAGSVGTADQVFLSNLASLDADIPQFIEAVLSSLASKSPVFLMFDEANELCSAFQKAVAGLLGRRSQRTLCLKVASQLHGFSLTRDTGRAAQELHDFVSLDLDSLYTNNQDAYYQRVKRIAECRLSHAGLSGDVNDFLPPNPLDLERLEQAKVLAAERFDALDPKTRPKDRANYIKKYAPAIVYQELTPAKAGKSYAGFDNLVHLSSGIVRGFLDCCSQMYSRFKESNPGANDPSAIPIAIQNEEIQNYSDAFIQSISDRIDSLRETEGEDARKYRDLFQLIQALGTLFRRRLMDLESREPRIISISVKDEPDERLTAALRLAEQDAFLHKVWYRSKRGTRKLPCYVLNRRLCPHFGLDAAGFQGRIEVSSAELAIALTDPDQFAHTVLSRGKRDSSLSTNLEQSQLWEW